MIRVLLLFLIVGALIADEEKQAEEINKLSFSFGYSLTTDFADELEPRIFQHTFKGGAAISNLTPYKFSFGIGIGAYFKTLGGDIWSDHSTGASGIEFSSLVLSAGKAFKAKYFKTKLAMTTSIMLSDEDRYEGFKALTGLTLTLSKSFCKGRYTFANSFGGAILSNTYSHSPAGGGPHPKYYLTYVMRHSVKIYKTIRFNAGFSVKRTYKFDDFTNNSFMSYFGISGSYKGLTLALSFKNGDFLHRDDVRLWYIDQYRKIATLSLGYKF